jgi:hypothetical protein
MAMNSYLPTLLRRCVYLILIVYDNEDNNTV